MRPASVTGKNAVVQQTNSAIRDFCAEKGITYIDLHHVLADGEGMLNAGYTYDGLHLNVDGYLAWVAAIRQYVK
jgi:lysophospholipase L1-like esterase